jgi:putative thioredoxin
VPLNDAVAAISTEEDNGPMAETTNLVTLTAENFHDVVIEGSHQRPVLVDFWADWCAPCRALMPVLAKLAAELAGKLTVAKLDTEQEQAIAAQIGIRSLPTVLLFKDGQVVDQFMGALPEAQVRELLERHLPRESDDLIARARRVLASGDAAGAGELLERARGIEPDNPRLIPAQAGVRAASGDYEGALALLERVPLEIADDPEVTTLRGRLHFAKATAEAPAEAVLTERLAADPGDSEARYLLAAHSAARGDYQAALDHLLTLMKRDRGYGDDAARKAMVMIFDLLGGEGPLVASYRPKMLSALY